MSGVLINIDVPDLEAGLAFYRAAFGLEPGRRLGAAAVELIGWPAKLYLLENAAGSTGAGGERRRYERHWTPVHLDVEAGLARALAAGAVAETAIRSEAYGRIVTLADPFGHGLCLIEFSAAGYDALI